MRFAGPDPSRSVFVLRISNRDRGMYRASPTSGLVSGLGEPLGDGQTLRAASSCLQESWNAGPSRHAWSKHRPWNRGHPWRGRERWRELDLGAVAGFCRKVSPWTPSVEQRPPMGQRPSMERDMIDGECCRTALYLLVLRAICFSPRS